jgi:hypothetical protein
MSRVPRYFESTHYQERDLDLGNGFRWGYFRQRLANLRWMAFRTERRDSASDKTKPLAKLLLCH